MEEHGHGSFRALALISIVLAFYLDNLYELSLVSLVETMFTDEYSYIFVALGMILLIALLEYRNIGLSFSIDLGNILLGTTLITLSFTTLILSNILDMLILQFKVLSLVLLIWGVATLLLDRESIRRLSYPLIALLFIIPLPREVIDPISSILSIYTAKLSSMVTGANLIIDPGTQTYVLSVLDKYGVIRAFNIAPICSGYISIMNILSLSIIVIYFAYRSSLSIGRKTLYTILLIALGVFLVYLGNLLRISLVIWITRWYSYELALEVFHQAPSLVYSMVGALIVILLAIKLFRWRGAPQLSIGVRNYYGVSPNIIAVFILTIIMLSLMSITYPSVEAYQNQFSSASEFMTLDELLTNTAYTLFRGLNASVRYVVDEPALTEVLGASIVKRFGLDVNGSLYEGYIEVAETPGRYHSWSVCLTVQGYRIYSVWSVNLEEGTYTFYEFSKGYEKLLMGLSIYSMPIYIGGEKTTAYIRVSIVKFGWGGEESILNILRGIRLSRAEESNLPLILWVNATIVLIAASIIYVVASIFIKYRRIITRTLPVVRR